MGLLEQGQKILAAYPLENSGFTSVDTQNPWVAAVQLSNVWEYYQPHAWAVLRWLLPAAAAAWVIVSALGRNLLLMRMGRLGDRRLPFRPLGMIGLQATWMAMFALTLFGWYRTMRMGGGHAHLHLR